MSERITLTRDGWTSMIIRFVPTGIEVLEYTDHYGHERWALLKKGTYENTPELQPYLSSSQANKSITKIVNYESS